MPLAVIPTQEDHMNTMTMSDAIRLNTPDKAISSAAEAPPRPDGSIEEALMIIEARLKSEGRDKNELRSLIKELLANNREKKEMYRRQAEARMERQADNTVKSQMEADEREALIDRDYQLFVKILEKSEGMHPGPILLSGPKPMTSRPVKKRGLIRRLLGLR